MPNLLQSIGQGFQRFGEGYNDPTGQKRAAAEAAKARARYSDAAVRSIETEDEQRRMAARRAAMAQDAFQVNRLLKSGNVDAATMLLQDRLDQLNKLGADPGDTQRAYDMVYNGQIDEAIAATDAVVQAGAAAGLLKLPGQGDGRVLTGSQVREMYGVDVDPNDLYNLKPDGTLSREVAAGGAGSGGFSASTQKLPDGSSVLVSNTGEVIVKRASGEIVRGEAANELVRQAQLFGAEIQGLRSGEREAGKQAITMSGEAYEKLQTVGSSKRLLQSAIQAIDDGAKTGPIMSRLPTVTQASAALNAVQNELGLNVIQNTTFGALSEKESEFALDTALPAKNMRPPQLRDWAVRKLEAQEKLEDYLYRAAVFLGTPGNTVADWMEVQKAQSQQDPASSEFDALWGPD